MSLKLVSPAVVEHVTGIWVKQLRMRPEENDQRLWSCPTFPYQIVSVEQVSPTRTALEAFEARRNELDRRLGPHNKLETLQGFYCPSSQEVLNQIVKEGFHNTFSGELTFCLDAPQAIQESLATHRVNKVLLVRISLGIKGVDFTEINHKYKIRNLHSVIPSFVITFQEIGESQKPVPQSPPPDSNVVELSLSAKQLDHISKTQSPQHPSPAFSSPPVSPTYASTSSARLPKYLKDLDASLED
jgi:hypothetical protein